MHFSKILMGYPEYNSMMTDSTTTTAGPPGVEHSRSLRQRVLLWLADRNMWAIMGTGFGLGFLVNRTRFSSVSWVFFLAGGLLPLVLQMVSDPDHGYEHEISNGMRLRYLVSALCWSITPWGIVTQILQIGGQLVPLARYRGRFPNRERHVPETELSLPFDGEWTAINGGVTKDSSHSWELVAQRYAYDFVITDEDGSTHVGDGGTLDDYYAYDEPIRVPADGTVIKARDDLRDHPHPGTGWVEWRTWDIRGNHVLIEHDDGEYSLLAHLQEDSVTVSPGDSVERGDVVGCCGSSGMSTEPHLHYQLQDHPNFWITAGLVPRLVDVAVSRDDDRRTDHDVYSPEKADPDDRYLWAGDRVATAER